MNLQGNIWGVLTVIIMLINTLLTLRNGRKTDRLHHEMNAMQDELVAETRRSAHAEGLAQGKRESDIGHDD
jgi:hypothetical protein